MAMTLKASEVLEAASCSGDGLQAAKQKHTRASKMYFILFLLESALWIIFYKYRLFTMVDTKLSIVSPNLKGGILIIHSAFPGSLFPTAVP